MYHPISPHLVANLWQLMYCYFYRLRFLSLRNPTSNQFVNSNYPYHPRMAQSLSPPRDLFSEPLNLSFAPQFVTSWGLFYDRADAGRCLRI